MQITIGDETIQLVRPPHTGPIRRVAAVTANKATVSAGIFAALGLAWPQRVARPPRDPVTRAILPTWWSPAPWRTMADHGHDVVSFGDAVYDALVEHYGDTEDLGNAAVAALGWLLEGLPDYVKAEEDAVFSEAPTETPTGT